MSNEILTAKTKLYGLIGHPVGHSFSPVFQNDLIATHGLDACYLAFDIPSDRIGNLRSAMDTLGIDGLNVTVPHKEAVIPQLDRVDESAQGIGAVNTLVRRSGELIGFNTDVLGFMRLLDSFEPEPETATVAVLGAGGASRAVLAALQMRGFKNIHIYNRTVSKAETLAGIFGLDSAAVHPMEAFSVEGNMVIINTTSVGLREGEAPVRLDGGDASTIVIDLIYNPLRTELLLQAQKLGMKTANGLTMLLYQGIRSFEIWHDLKVEDSTVIDLVERMEKKWGDKG